MKKFIAYFLILFVFLISMKTVEAESWWDMQSIDTMKYSRDLAREKLSDEDFLQTIDTQVRNIAETGVTHVAIATPYDEEFFPFLKSWVDAARKYNLKVWFRGNISGWEGWFGYSRISRQEHLEKVQEFVNNHNDIFEDGDIFTGCPECENGGPGDPRFTGDVEGHRQFLIDEYKTLKKLFNNLGVKVQTTYNPMNADVAKLIMNPETTKELGGIVVIDHYVKTPEKLNNDINTIATISEGKVALGEYGVPIPDINGNLTEEEQAEWLEKSLTLLVKNKNLIGINYWVNTGGSTQLWKSDNAARKGVDVLKKYFKPKAIRGVVVNELNKPIKDANVFNDERKVISNSSGEFTIHYIDEHNIFDVTADGYKSTEFIAREDNEFLTLKLIKEKESFLFKLQKFFYGLFRKNL